MPLQISRVHTHVSCGTNTARYVYYSRPMAPPSLPRPSPSPSQPPSSKAPLIGVMLGWSLGRWLTPVLACPLGDELISTRREKLGSVCRASICGCRNAQNGVSLPPAENAVKCEVNKDRGGGTGGVPARHNSAACYRHQRGCGSTSALGVIPLSTPSKAIVTNLPGDVTDEFRSKLY